jgi:hypothetical protein
MPVRVRACRHAMKDKMPPPQAAAILKKFPDTRHHPDWNLVTWHPDGVFNDKLADRVVEFIESRERIEDEPFHRYTDMTGFTRIELRLNHIFHIARRRKQGYRGATVKSALFAVRLISLGIAQMYAEMMNGGRIHVGVFRDRASAAEWLGVPVQLLKPPKV